MFYDLLQCLQSQVEENHTPLLSSQVPGLIISKAVQRLGSGQPSVCPSANPYVLAEFMQTFSPSAYVNLFVKQD